MMNVGDHHQLYFYAKNATTTVFISLNQIQSERVQIRLQEQQRLAVVQQETRISFLFDRTGVVPLESIFSLPVLYRPMLR